MAENIRRNVEWPSENSAIKVSFEWEPQRGAHALRSRATC